MRPCCAQGLIRSSGLWSGLAERMRTFLPKKAVTAAAIITMVCGATSGCGTGEDERSGASVFWVPPIGVASVFSVAGCCSARTITVRTLIRACISTWRSLMVRVRRRFEARLIATQPAIINAPRMSQGWETSCACTSVMRLLLQRNQTMLLWRTKLALGVQGFDCLREIFAGLRRFDDVVYQSTPCRNIGIRKGVAI